MIKLRRKYLEWRLRNLESDYKFATEHEKQLTDNHDPVATGEYMVWRNMAAEDIRKIKNKLAK
jgi:hypothetical protein